MTQGEAEIHTQSPPEGASDRLTEDSTRAPRDVPMIHIPTDPPLCEKCQKLELSFFDPNCSGCAALLSEPSTTISQVFAILRQWTPQTQQSLEMLIREILSRGAHVNDRDGLTDMTLLHYAAKAGANGMGDVDESCRMINLLVSKGADVYMRCRWTHMAPLHYATYFDTAPAMTQLLETTKGIDVDSPCAEFDHGTPLHIAASNLSVEAVRVLLQNGANPHAKDDLGRTPLDCIPDPDSFEPGSETAVFAAQIQKVLKEAQPVTPSRGEEAQRYDEVQIGAALQSMGIQIGDKVVVGGVKTGTLRFCGSTEFASGVWAGIELDEPEGKNDGSVADQRYFRCPPKRGIFAPLSKVCKPGSERTWMSRQLQIDFGKIDTSHVTSRIDTGLRRGPRVFGLAEGEQPLNVCDRVLVAGQRRGYVRYSGQTKFAPGWWYGIELDRPVGKNDGTVNGERYFTCKPKHGVFAPSSRVQRIPDHHGSRDSLDTSASFLEKNRRLSSGSRTGSQPNISFASAAKMKTSIVRAKKSVLSPKSSGGAGAGQNRRASVGPVIPPEYAEYKLRVGMSVFCNNEMGVIRYIGPVEFAEGVWLGVELRTAVGKNDGTVQDKRYFTCKPNHGLIVRPSKVTVKGINGAKLLGDPSEYLPAESKDNREGKDSNGDKEGKE